MNNSVLKEWVTELTLQMQSTLLTGIRGPDGVGKSAPVKVLIRRFRSVLLKDAFPSGPTNTFISASSVNHYEEINAFFASIDEYPHHWLMHFIHCAEIVGYKHPDADIAQFWKEFYFQACENLHMNPEIEQQMDIRLAGNGS